MSNDQGVPGCVKFVRAYEWIQERREECSKRGRPSIASLAAECSKDLGFKVSKETIRHYFRYLKIPIQIHDLESIRPEMESLREEIAELKGQLLAIGARHGVTDQSPEGDPHV